MSFSFANQEYHSHRPSQPISLSQMDPSSNHTPDYFWRPPSSPLTVSEYSLPPPFANAQPPLSPFRALEEIHLERTYLLSSLRAQTHSTSQLTNKLSLLVTNFKLQNPDLHPQGKLRKQLGWTKNRLQQAGLQKRTISARLDQLASEIQTREHWLDVEREQQRIDAYHRDQILGYQQGLCDGLKMRIPLDPECPAFQPRGCSQIWPQWGESEQSFSEESRTENKSQVSPDPVSSEVSNVSWLNEFEFTGAEHSQKRNLGRSASIDLGFLGLSSGFEQASMLKRHSFTSLPGCDTIWARTSEEQFNTETDVEARTEDLG